MIFNFIKKYDAEIVCLALALFLLSKMLLPGYVLTLDMAWSPEMPYAWNTDAPNNAYPLWVLIHALTLIIPSWVVQKIVLGGLIFSLLYIPWRFLPFVEGVYARIFSAGVFALNPFVYARVLAGQWFILLAYALLPLLLYALVRLSQKPDRRSGAIFFLVLSLIGLLSIHFLYLSCLVSALWLGTHMVCDWWRGGEDSLRVVRILRYGTFAGLGFIILNLFWIVPVALRSAPIEARFDETYFSAFASAGHGVVPVVANVAVLGGFWGENLVWGKYFAWPQDTAVFWIAVFFIFIFIGRGVVHLLRNPATRFHAGVILGIGIFAYVTALGMADTPFQNFNLFLYEHVPFWSGLRDSHKIAGVLALVYAVFAGVGVSAFLSKIKKRSVSTESFVSMLVLLVPILFGMYMWGGMHGGLRSVWYPADWYEAKSIVDKMPAGEKTLVLPWHGYLSLDFADNKIVGNPTQAFFGRTRVIAGRGVELGKIYDQEVDAEYRDIDAFLLQAQNLTPEIISAGLRERGVTTLIIMTNPDVALSGEGLTHWVTEYSSVVERATPYVREKTWSEMLGQKTHTIFGGSSIIIKEILP